MTPEQWRRVEDLFDRGAELSAERREELLRLECTDDPAIAAEVRALWSNVEASPSFLTPLVELPETERMNRQVLERGHIVAQRFTVLELLGAGGMGEVYRARDERLGRIVALKVLSGRVGSQTEYRLRLEREARAVSSLGHPRICTLFDVGTDQDMTYLVMEFLSGEPLSSRVARGPLPINDVLRIGLQIAEALECAHQAGIVHRDLKPANVMLTDAGVKLLDFGVAKRTEAAVGVTEPQSTITTEGQIVGTVAYMSPEQAEGRQVGPRSDVFSLGSILYEMTTGRRPFQGDSSMSTLAAILRADPTPVRKLLPASPPELDELIRRCLTKDADLRPATAADVRTDLEKLCDRFRAHSTHRRLAGSVAVAALGVLVLGGLGWLLMSRTAVPRTAAAPVRLTVEAGNATTPAISPDGKLLAYASDRNGNYDIFIRQIGGESEVRLTETSHNEVAPSFTPDARHIVFQSDEPGAAIQVVPSLGGDRRVLAAKGCGPRVSPDGATVALWTASEGGRCDFPATGSQIVVVPFGGGKLRVLQSGFDRAAYPTWFEDSRRLAFAGIRSFSDSARGWWVAALDDSPARPIHSDTAIAKLGHIGTTPRPMFVRNGAVYGVTRIGDTGTLVSVRFDPKRPEAGSQATRVMDVTDRLDAASAAADGTVVFAVSTLNDDLYRLRFDPRTRRVVGEPEQLTNEPSRENFGTLSADGRLLAYLSERDGGWGLWIRDLQRRHDRKLAAVPSTLVSQAFISPDGDRIVYQATDGRFKVISVGGGEPTPIASHLEPFRNIGWTKEGALRGFHPATVGNSRSFNYMEVSFPSMQVLRRLGDYGQHNPCTAGKHLEICWSKTSIGMRSVGSQTPLVELIPMSQPLALLMRNEDETVIYWHPGGNEDVLWGREVDPVAGVPRGAPFAAHRFQMRARIASMDCQSGEYRNHAAVVTRRTTTSNLWLQKLVDDH